MMSSGNSFFQKENIAEPGKNDVMFGRGGGTNNHNGNIKFRKLCYEHKFRYLAASKVDKPKVAREVVGLWRQQIPPGRFLTKAAKNKSKGHEISWHDVGDQKAREKASQCLRERTTDVIPFIQQLQKQGSGLNQRQMPTGELPISTSQAENRIEETLYDFDTAAIAVALLNKQIQGEESPLLTRYLKKLAEAPNDDDMSIDENASVTAIAKALFKNVKPDDDEMTFTDFLQSGETLCGDLDSIFTDTMSKCSWVKPFQLDTDMMSTHSLGRIGENSKVNDMHFPSFNQKYKYAKSNNSTMSMLSEITDILEDGKSYPRSVTTNSSRAAKMKAGKKESNMSMLSELTDMTENFSHFDIKN